MVARSALPFLLALVAPQFAVAAGEGSCPSGSCNSRAAAALSAEQDRALHLLQTRGGSAGLSSGGGKRKPPYKQVNLALEGGGAASTTIFAAFLAGSMHVLAEEEGMDPSTATFESTGLFRSVPNFTTVSGGSWMLAGLAYSPYFLETVELIAQRPERDADIWNERWTQPLLGRATNITGVELLRIIETCILGAVLPPEIAKLFLPAVAELLKTFLSGASQTLIEDLILFSLYFAQQQPDPNGASVQYTWQNYIDEFLLRTTKITPVQVMGKKPNTAFDGKEWIPVVSQLNPARGDFAVQLYVRDLLYEQNKKFVRYQMQQGKTDTPSCPWFAPGLCELIEQTCGGLSQFLFGPHYVVPARFSVSLGKGKGQAAPLPWCDDDSCKARRVKYEYLDTYKPWWDLSCGDGLTITNITAPAPQTQGEVSLQAFDLNAGRLPITAVTAATSAAAGVLALLSTGLPPACGLSGSAPAATNVEGGRTFTAGEAFLKEERDNIASGGTFTQEDFNKAVKMVLQLVTDGGFVDNTGAMTAIGEGASEVSLLMALNQSYIQMFFPDSGFSDYANYHIFQQTQSQATQNLLDGQRFILPSNKFLHLNSIRYGSFNVLTTDNEDARAFGIPPNKQVLLEWVFFDTNVGLFEPIFSGSTNPFTALTEEYNLLVQEVIQTLIYPPNRKHMRVILRALGALK